MMAFIAIDQYPRVCRVYSGVSIFISAVEKGQLLES